LIKPYKWGKPTYVNDHNFGFYHVTFFANTKGSYGTKTLPPPMENIYFCLDVVKTILRQITTIFNEKL